MSDLDKIYAQLSPAGKSNHVLGQIFYIPAYLQMNDYYVVRIGQWDRLQSIETARFRIEKTTIHKLGKDSDLYQHMPIADLKLKADEEIIVKKVKRRPGVMIVRDCVDTRKCANYVDNRCGKQPGPSTHVFAPVVSLRKEGNLGKDYPDSFIEKVKAGELPEFLYLPPMPPSLPNESMAVLTQLQTHGESVIEETSLALDPFYLASGLEVFWQDLETKLIPSNT